MGVPKAGRCQRLDEFIVGSAAARELFSAATLGENVRYMYGCVRVHFFPDFPLDKKLTIS
jgi:hypothetical protein